MSITSDIMANKPTTQAKTAASDPIDTDTKQDSTNMQDTSDADATSAPQASATPAADQVLTTTELLEHILTYLNTTEVARAHRIQKYWKEVIKNSKKLRRILFLEPAPIDKILVKDPKGMYFTTTDKSQLDAGARVISRTHPLLLRLDQLALNGLNGLSVGVAGVWLGIGDFAARQLGQWEEALLSQPAPKEVSFEYSADASSGFGWHTSSIAREQGVTLGMLQRALARIQEEQRKMDGPDALFNRPVYAKCEPCEEVVGERDFYGEGMVSEDFAAKLVARSELLASTSITVGPFNQDDAVFTTA